MFSMSAVAAVFAVLAAPQRSAAAPPRQDVSIDHVALPCAVAGMHPKLRACVRSARAAAPPRIYFRGAGGRSWHYVEMTREGGGCFGATLPRPLADLARFEYYVVAHTAKPPFDEAQTSVFPVEVRPPSVGCSTPFEPRARVRVFAADGPARPPLGFDGSGVSSLTKDRPNRPSRLWIAGGAAAATALAVGLDPGGDPAPTPPPAALRTTMTAGAAPVLLVLNGERIGPASASISLQAPVRRGLNLLEASLVADGAPAQWTLELGLETRLRRGSLHVVTGRALAESDRAVSVHLAGKRGERVVVRFEVD
jgi:hypothetical protein